MPENTPNDPKTNPIITLQTINHDDWNHAHDSEPPTESIPGMWTPPTSQDDHMYHILDAVDLRGTYLHTACGLTMQGEHRPNLLYKTPPQGHACINCIISSLDDDYRRVREGARI